MQGVQGDTGATGATGPANTLSIGTVQKGSEAAATITGSAPNQTLNLTLPKGDKGDTGSAGQNGQDGNGIVGTEKTGTSGLVDTYTITYTNGDTDTFTVTNGQDGASQWGQISGTLSNQTDLQNALNSKVGFTDYASNSTGGVIKTSSDYSTVVSTDDGVLRCSDWSYAGYTGTMGNNAFISKGTLENVITGKGLVSNTDYASSSTGGVIKSNGSGFQVLSSSGKPYCDVYSYENYSSKANTEFISKGTLEYVITGKGLVSNTDYATANTAGVFKVGYGTYVSGTNGYIMCPVRTYTQYQNDNEQNFIGKGTLENVLTARIGDIEALLDRLDVGEGV